MALLKLNFDSIGEMGIGTAGEIITAMLQKAANDIIDRGSEDHKPREVNIKIILNYDPKAKEYVGEVEAGVKLPPLRSMPTRMKETQNRGEVLLAFQSGAPDNPEQQTFGQMDEGVRGERVE